jgi:hypothetical protein
MDEMGSFKKVKVPIVLDGDGIGVLPSDYFHLVGDPYYWITTTNRRKVELVTSLEFGNRELDYFSKSTPLYPLSFMGFGVTAEDMSLYVSPVTDMAGKTIYVDYLRKVNTPFLDYYVDDTNLNITYMDETTTPVSIPLGSTARNGTTGLADVTSMTVNFEFHEHDIPQIINLLLGAVGISLPDEMLIQVEEKDEKKIEQG